MRHPDRRAMSVRGPRPVDSIKSAIQLDIVLQDRRRRAVRALPKRAPAPVRRRHAATACERCAFRRIGESVVMAAKMAAGRTLQADGSSVAFLQQLRNCISALPISPALTSVAYAVQL